MGRGQQGKGLRVFRPRVCAVHCAYSKVGEVIERRGADDRSAGNGRVRDPVIAVIHPRLDGVMAVAPGKVVDQLKLFSASSCWQQGIHVGKTSPRGVVGASIGSAVIEDKVAWKRLLRIGEINDAKDGGVPVPLAMKLFTRFGVME